MTSFQEVPLQTSNFAHVIFQNVAKSYLPNAHLECRYTLTPYIHPHAKDWVGIFKVGWSTARDCYTFLWSPMPEHYVEGSTVKCVLAFEGYYLPNDDGEFYQFCYVTHKGEIRGASTPFQFRASSPVEELLTMEDEVSSDMLVWGPQAGLLELKIEKIMKEKEELLKKERCEHLETEQKDLIEVSQNLKMENEEFKKRYSDATSKALQLEEDIVPVTHKAIEKKTELDSVKDKLRKAEYEREQLECQLKIEKDEKELYKPALQYGNPYTTQETKDGADAAFYLDEIQRPPVRVPSWEDNVVCSQPARNLSQLDGLEDPDDSKEDENVPTAPDPPSQHLSGHGAGFCFDSSFDAHKKCPLCELMFLPNYDQSKFEEHVESHWRVCPMCSEQFPPDYDQQGLERHIQTHFDQNILNFD
ncbi:Tax1-binding protein 1-like protein [Heterocephalus glaber]|uniref:Tax1-binding protein 1-like protein n=1 Tax=Heterocephalus glaber TaxID=10181 RepID=G5AMX1_HETGA|nr:Tax1-binding protein 1-like protein [Heterocephalus glaber]